MLLQQQQKQHCLFTKHKTDRKTNNIIHQIAQQQNDYYKKTNIYENHYFTWIFSSFFKHHKRTFCLLFKSFILLKPFFLQILLNFYCNYFHLITTTCCELCMWILIFCDNYYIFKYYFLVFINKVFALNQFVFIFRDPTRLWTFFYFQDYYYYF